MSEQPHIYLVRTPEELVHKSIVAMGWSWIDFSKATDAEQAVRDTEAVGKRAHQIRRFFRIQDGDLIVAPLPYSIAIGKATGGIFYDEGYEEIDGSNQRRVEFPLDAQGNLKTIPRNSLSEAFQRRLRMKGNSVTDLTEFADELTAAFDAVLSDKEFSWSSRQNAEIEDKSEAFKTKLLANIQQGKTNLQTGGYGLEQLICELLETEGYQANILSKREFEGSADADVIASRSDPCANVELLVQVKHHSGYSDNTGINQLDEISKLDRSDFAGHEFVFITSANVAPKVQLQADEKKITVIDGAGLVAWISDKLASLSDQTKSALGISEDPVVLDTY